MTIRWEAAGASDVGRARRGNEDAFLLDPERGLFLVADGMGGHAAGEVASSIAVEVAGRMLSRAVEDAASRDELAEVMAEAFQEARREIVRAGRKDPRKEGMGTTLTAWLLRPEGWSVIGHLGDSRAYRLRDGALQLLTHDHTWVQREVEAGRMHATSAEAHPLAHILTRVLSADLPASPDVQTTRVQPGDTLLISSDGLHGMVPAAEILRIARQQIPLLPLLDELLAAANARGGRDNITVIAIRVLAADEPDESPR
jgi:PPM family protein phosphatase